MKVPNHSFEWLDRIPYWDLALQAVAASGIGLVSSLGVLVFKWAIEQVQSLGYDRVGAWLSQFGGFTLAFIPALGGLIVGLMLHYWIKAERHHGVAGIMEAVALAGGRLRYGRMPLKALASAISIGSGASVGPEDPSVQIGSNIGSMLGQKLRLSDERTRVLVGAGAAAGIATAFNAPIAGVFFATEIILGEFTTSNFGMLVIGAVAASTLTRALVGPNPAFAIPPYAFGSPLELPLYFVLGILAAFVAVVYVGAIYRAHDWFHHSRLPRWLRPALAGLLVGVVGLALPQVLGDSYDTIASILFGHEDSPALLAILLAAKLLLTAICLGAGFVGGTFAPALLLGAALGGLFGLLIDPLFPGLYIEPSAFALVGMAAVLAGTVRAPVTAFMLLFEMTNDYHIFLPLMFAVVVCIFVAGLLQRDSVYTKSLARKGVHLRQGRDVDLMESMLVKDVMETNPMALKGSESLGEASAMMENLRVHGLPILDVADRLVGVITAEDIRRALENGDDNIARPVREFCSSQLVVTTPDETVQQAIQRMTARGIGRLPVVERGQPRHLVGWLSRQAILNAYDLALVRQVHERHQAEQVHLGAVSGAQILEIEVRGGSPLVGMTMAEIPWPSGALVASLRRGRKLIIPHGDTRLEAGDRLAMVVEDSEREAVIQMVESGQNS